MQGGSTEAGTVEEGQGAEGAEADGNMASDVASDGCSVHDMASDVTLRCGSQKVLKITEVPDEEVPEESQENVHIFIQNH